MKSVKGIIFVTIILFLSVSTLSASEVITNESVITMVKAGLSEELIISKIKTSQTQFDVSINAILKLKKDGIYETALAAPGLDNKKKAYIYYKLGELEYQILDNKKDTKAYWEKAVALSPDNRIGKLAKERLSEITKEGDK